MRVALKVITVFLLLFFYNTQANTNSFVNEKHSKLTSEDLLIIEISLKHFSTTEESSTFHINKDLNQIILDNRTPEKSGFIMGSQLSAELDNNQDCYIPFSLRESLKKRNTSSIFLGKINPSDVNIIIGDLGKFPSRIINLRTQESARKIYPQAKLFINAWLPGYSDDKSQAIFRFFFGPTAHGATATYFLHKIDGRWEIECYLTSFYA